MVAWSKVLHCSCYELGHTWEPSCRTAISEIAFHAYKESIKLYGTFYLVAALIRGKGWDYILKELPFEVLQSALFLGTNAFGFIGSFCLWRLLVGQFTFLSSGYLPGACACLAVILERKERRSALAVYLANLATETLFRMGLSRKMYQSIPNGEVLLFSSVLSVYMYLFKKPGGLDKSMSKLFKYLFGKAESASTAGVSIEEESPIAASLDVPPPEMSWSRRRQRIGSMKPWTEVKHELCQHEHSCTTSSLMRFGKVFSCSYAGHACLKLMGSVKLLLRKPSLFLNCLHHRDSLAFALFLSLLSTSFNTINCILRWIRNVDEPVNAAIAGFISGWSMFSYRSTSTTMYLTSKLAEILYFKGIKVGYVPYLKNADIVLYVLSTALVFHTAVFEPHNLRSAYWKFLMRLTNGRFAEMNRKLLDVYGTDASKMFPEFKPNYDPKYTMMTA